MARAARGVVANARLAARRLVGPTSTRLAALDRRAAAWSSSTRNRTALTGLGKDRYKVTDRHFQVQKGTLTSNTQQIPLIQLFDIDAKQSMSQKVCGVGSVIVHVVSERGGRETLTVDDLPDWRDLGDLLNERSRALRLEAQRAANTQRYEHVGGVMPVGSLPAVLPPVPLPTSAPASDPIADLERLGRLRDSGVLTDEEFARQKAAVLKRI